MQNVFGKRNKRVYGLWDNIIYNLRSSYDFDKKLFYSQLLPAFPAVAAAYLGTLIPAEIVRGLSEGFELSYLVRYICVLTFVMFLCNMMVSGMNAYILYFAHMLSVYFSKKCFHKIMRMDYDLLEGQEEQDLIGNAWRTIRQEFNFEIACEALPQCLSSLIAILFYGVLIARKNILLVILMLFSVTVSMKLLSVVRKKHAAYHEKLSRYAKETAYISRQAVESSAGKDVRIYGMMDWFLKNYDDALHHMDKIFAGIHNWYFLRSLSDAFIAFLVDAASWGFLLYMFVDGQMTAAEFVLYLGLINGFGTYLENLIRMFMEMGPMSVSLSYLREFLDMENTWGDKEEGRIPAALPFAIELRDVSYTYPGSETPTLSHIDLKIEPGEKLALLGLNGAGKTTLVKLLCGFYHPTEGQILVNGIPVTDYDREAYYKSISVLFQDALLLPVTLSVNLTGQKPKRIDRKRLREALILSGFWKEYNDLPKKGETMLVREVNGEALDFSGGEIQKLLFARALYQDSRLMILDEPTAALDPIAENELYQNLSEAVKGKTSIYISHRLSSTRFCDRIILLENGRIIEEGTHESLMAEKTRYAELFEIQSRYYKDREDKIRRSQIMGDTYVEDDQDKEGVFSWTKTGNI